MNIRLNLSLVLLVAAGIAAADDKAAFEKLKGLAGTWTGTGSDGSSKTPMTVKYRVVSNGSALEETIAPGTPHEMITMYYMDGNALKLTHYCAMGNQPRMKVASTGDASEVKFEFEGGSNCKAGGMYMSGADFHLVGANHLKTDWTLTAGGKAIAHMSFDVNREGGDAK